MSGLCLRGKWTRWYVQQKAEDMPLANRGAWFVKWPTSSLYWAVMQPGGTGHKLQPHCFLEVSPVNEVKYSEAPAPAPWTIEWSKCMCIFRTWRMKQQNCAKRNYIYLICPYRVGMEKQQRALDVSHLGCYVIIQGLAPVGHSSKPF